jgi:LacI family transcriptional regulator
MAGRVLKSGDGRRRRVLLALSWYAGQIHEGVAQFAREAGWILNLDALRSGSIPPNWRGDGIIAILGSNDRLDRQVLGMGVPVVNIGYGGPARLPTVTTDDVAIGRLAVEHFVSRGFRHYAFYLESGGPGERNRCRAFTDAVTDRGFTPHLIDWPHGPGRQGRSSTTRLNWLARQIAALPKPIALFAEFDDRAMQILQACEVAGVPVPEQAAVLGVDNDALRCDFAPVPLSSIDDDQHRQGYAASAMLDRILNGKTLPSTPRGGGTIQRVPPRDVVVRQSTDILAVEHPLVAGALRAVWEHYAEPVLASDIADMFPMSSRRLHDAFCQHIGHSIADELARKRVERVKELLTSTDKKLIEITRASGFSSPDRLTKVFVRLTGVSPSRYRHQLRATRRGGRNAPTA